MVVSYFHMSKDRLEVGTILAPKGSDHLDSKIEAILTKMRPTGSIARKDAVFLSETEDASKHGLPYNWGYLHSVEAVGPIERRDSFWVGLLQRRHSNHKAIRDRVVKLYADLSDEDIANRYWGGAESSSPNWEVVARSAVIADSLETPIKLRTSTTPRPLILKPNPRCHADG